jgi:assimilatory nitrate reductase electron transfer subunit
MVGHRFADELVRLGRDRFELHLVGEEEYEPYNRILLSDVLAGRTEVSALTLPLPAAGVHLHRGVAAVEVDRVGRRVVLADGAFLRYDRLVLATGARAFVPPLAGLHDRPRHVHVLRTLDDCRDVTARALNARHAVVLGGGVLGLEVACGLRRRGVAVTVLDLDDHPMAAQLDPAPATALRAALARLDVEVRTGTSVAEVVAADGELVAVGLTDGTVLAADLLLVSCGVRPETTLAAAAGLPVDRGVLVDDDLATTDPRVHAIGDCAQGPDGVTGLLAPGWRQAERLAALLAGQEPADGSPLPPETVRLKAAGVDLVTTGVRASAAGPGDRVVSVSDPQAGRHLDLVLRGDRLVGSTCLGMPEVAAATAVVLERGTPAPLDPLALLRPAAADESASPLHMPGDTTVCRCNTVTKNDLVRAWEQGADSVGELARATRATTGCGGCTDAVCGLLDWLRSSDPAPAAGPSQPAAVPVAAPVARP